MCCIHSKRDWATILCGALPLMIGCILIATIFSIWGGLDISFSIINAPSVFHPNLIVSILSALVKLSIGIFGILTVITRKPCFASCVACSYKVCIAAFAAGFLVKWILWICDLTGIIGAEHKPWLPSSSEIAEMVTDSIVTILFFALGYWGLSVMRSLHNVLSAGGTGWEGLNYKDIKIERALLAINDGQQP